MEIHRLGPVWIVVAHESGARIFNRLNSEAPLELIERIDHPIGRAKNRELKSDRPGREEEWGPSAGKHAFDKHISPTQKNAEDFARELAVKIDKARDLNQFDYLILVAGPKFLGSLQRFLPRATGFRVVGTVNQNLGNIGDREIPSHIEAALETFDRSQGLKTA